MRAVILPKIKLPIKFNNNKKVLETIQSDQVFHLFLYQIFRLAGCIKFTFFILPFTSIQLNFIFLFWFHCYCHFLEHLFMHSVVAMMKMKPNPAHKNEMYNIREYRVVRM